jgi:hypothetical protein
LKLSVCFDIAVSLPDFLSDALNADGFFAMYPPPAIARTDDVEAAGFESVVGMLTPSCILALDLPPANADGNPLLVGTADEDGVERSKCGKRVGVARVVGMVPSGGLFADRGAFTDELKRPHVQIDAFPSCSSASNDSSGSFDMKSRKVTNGLQSRVELLYYNR